MMIVTGKVDDNDNGDGTTSDKVNDDGNGVTVDGTMGYDDDGDWLARTWRRWRHVND